MITVNRANKPQVLVDKADDWKKAIRTAKGAKALKLAVNKYQHDEIKDALVTMFSGKCAYCESQIRHIDYGHIEHFRPKGDARFRQLSVEWTNLLLACGICNGPENKGTKFPEAASDGPLVNPVDENPASHFTFEFDPVGQIAAVVPTTPRGITTERTLGLNRPALVKRRTRIVKMLLALAKMYKTDPDAKTLLDAAVLKEEEYSAFAIPIHQQAQ